MNIPSDIRPLSGPEEYAVCTAIWLEASLAGHDFVPDRFWRAQADAVRSVYLPSAEIFLAVAAGEPAGFAAMKGGALAALFCLPAYWGQGIGAALLRFLQQRHAAINLAVYSKNSRTLRFYQKHGFRKTGERQCSFTGEAETLLRWAREPHRP